MAAVLPQATSPGAPLPSRHGRRLSAATLPSVTITWACYDGRSTRSQATVLSLSWSKPELWIRGWWTGLASVVRRRRRAADRGPRRRRPRSAAGRRHRLGEDRTREIQADPDVRVAFKRAGDDVGPQETTECLAVYHLGRRSLLKTRQHLLNEAEALLCGLPEEIRAHLPDRPEVRPRLEALAEADRSVVTDRAGRLRLELLERHRLDIAELDRRVRETTREIAELVPESGSTLSELCAIAERSAAELLVEVGDPRRFASAGAFARFNGAAPLADGGVVGRG